MNEIELNQETRDLLDPRPDCCRHLARTGRGKAALYWRGLLVSSVVGS